VAGNAFTEIGRSGLQRWSGWIYEEFLRELRGRKGIEIFKEMSDNDDIVGAILFAIEMLMRQTVWNIKEAGNSEADIRATEFIFSCMHDMDETWSDFISEVLSFLTFGWSWHEIIYKRRMGKTRNPDTRSKFDDGLIGWRKLPIRSQDTLWQWVYDDHENIKGMIQCAPPTFEQVFLPIEKALHIRTKSRKANPEGRSILRNAYRPWWFKRRIQEIEGIGIERDLAGLPMLEAPEGADIWSDEAAADLARAERLVQRIRRDEKEGIVIGNGWKLTLLTTGGRRQFDTNAIIERYDNRIAMTVLADFVLLGHQKVGSFALSSDKTELFGVALGAYLDLICEMFNNQAIPRLLDINGDAFQGMTGYPELIHSDIEKPNLIDLARFVKDLVGIGAITPDEDMEDYLRMAADLPDRDPNTTYMGALSRNPEHEPEPAIGGSATDRPPDDRQGTYGSGFVPGT